MGSHKAAFVDTCDGQTGACENAATFPGCSPNHPCVKSDMPGASDAAVVECVCAQLPHCCEKNWGTECVDLAAGSCGAQCDCTTLPPEEIA